MEEIFYDRILEKIKEADGILIGASNGLSIAEGYNIFANDERFYNHFSDFQKKYGIKSLIQGSFFDFPTENEKWSYYSRMAYYYMYHTKPSSLLQSLYELIKEKPYFIITSNTDDHFARAGFKRKYILELEGSMKDMQCIKGCHNSVYSNKDLLVSMHEKESGMKIPTKLIPKCPICGGAMQIHVPINSFFIQSEEWYVRNEDYKKFINHYHNKKLLILEFGVGIRNRMIKAPLMKLADSEPNAFYITFNKGDDIYIPVQLKNKALGIDGDLSIILPKLFEKMKQLNHR